MAFDKRLRYTSVPASIYTDFLLQGMWLLNTGSSRNRVPQLIRSKWLFIAQLEGNPEVRKAFCVMRPHTSRPRAGFLFLRLVFRNSAMCPRHFHEVFLTCVPARTPLFARCPACG